jgi:GPI-anchor transamidase subunit GAA1
LNLEIADMNVDKLEMRLEGANGKLPNLDLFNTIIRICRTIQLKCQLESEKSSLSDYSYYNDDRVPINHAYGIENMLRMMFRQASGAPQSAHGYFLEHRIEALTIMGRRQKKQQQTKQDRQNFLKVTR